MTASTAAHPPQTLDTLAIGFQPSPPETDTGRLHRLHRTLYDAQSGRPFLSFPDHLTQVTAALAPLMSQFTDHQGDPYDPAPLDEHARGYEQAVVDYFASLAGADRHETRGRVTATPREALLHGLHTARHDLPDPAVYISEHAHPTVVDTCRLLGLPLVLVRALADGRMDPEDLHRQTRARRGAGALVVAACGTPLHGAIDNVPDLRAAALGPVHIHVDASAGGLAAAHSTQAPPWSLAHGAHSVTFSAHPLLGLPVPAGITLTRRDLAPLPGTPSTRPEPPGSSALTALLVWTRLRSLGRFGVAAMAARCQSVADYALDRLQAAGASPQRCPGSLTVTFDRPPGWVAAKWRLAWAGTRARITTTAPMTHTAVDDLAADLSAARQEAAA